MLTQTEHSFSLQRGLIRDGKKKKADSPEKSSSDNSSDSSEESEAGRHKSSDSELDSECVVRIPVDHFDRLLCSGISISLNMFFYLDTD